MIYHRKLFSMYIGHNENGDFTLLYGLLIGISILIFQVYETIILNTYLKNIIIGVILVI